MILILVLTDLDCNGNRDIDIVMQNLILPSSDRRNGPTDSQEPTHVQKRAGANAGASWEEASLLASVTKFVRILAEHKLGSLERRNVLVIPSTLLRYMHP